ncbi:MAG TPA: hypothetical protein VJ915_12970, partial [Balneolaceae bacterium]|nr:hypothetical protein [Balneolaceae bacterium]
MYNIQNSLRTHLLYLLLLIFTLGLSTESIEAQSLERPFTLDLGFGKGFLNNPDATANLQPEFDLSYIPGRFGIGINAGLDSFEPSFSADQYREGFEEFTAITGSNDKFSSYFIGLGPRLHFGSRLPVQFKAGLDFTLSYTDPPSQSVRFQDEDGPFHDLDLPLYERVNGDDFKKWSASIKPQFQINYSIPGVNRFGLHLTTGIQHQLSDRDISIQQRDLSRVRQVDNAREMFFQFEMAPLIEKTEQPPKTSFFVNAGIKIKFGGSKAPQASSPGFTGNMEPPGQDGEPKDGGEDPPENEEEEEDQEEPEQLFVGENGEFEVENLDITGNGPFSGTGEVFIDWL